MVSEAFQRTCSLLLAVKFCTELGAHGQEFAPTVLRRIRTIHGQRLILPAPLSEASQSNLSWNLCGMQLPLRLGSLDNATHPEGRTEMPFLGRSSFIAGHDGLLATCKIASNARQVALRIYNEPTHSALPITSLSFVTPTKHEFHQEISRLLKAKPRCRACKEGSLMHV